MNYKIACACMGLLFGAGYGVGLTNGMERMNPYLHEQRDTLKEQREKIDAYEQFFEKLREHHIQRREVPKLA